MRIPNSRGSTKFLHSIFFKVLRRVPFPFHDPPSLDFAHNVHFPVGRSLPSMASNQGKKKAVDRASLLENFAALTAKQRQTANPEWPNHTAQAVAAWWAVFVEDMRDCDEVAGWEGIPKDRKLTDAELYDIDLLKKQGSLFLLYYVSPAPSQALFSPSSN